MTQTSIYKIIWPNINIIIPRLSSCQILCETQPIHTIDDSLHCVSYLEAIRGENAWCYSAQ